MNAGIDSIELFIPRPYVHYMDFAAARDIEPGKLEKGIGVKSMAIPDSDEDTATMAATACLRLMKKNHLSPKSIGRIDIATECGLDESKPLTTYVIGMLEQVYGKGSFQHCMGVEYKSACVAGSRALLDNVNWVNAGENRGKTSIVITSDIAKYDIKSPGEYTQGAGAVAMLVTGKPRLVSLDRGVASWVIRDDYDFYRPHGRDTPIVNGKNSLNSYLEQVAAAFRGFKQKALENRIIKADRDFIGAIDYLAFHLPFPKMGKWALEKILADEYDNETMQILGVFGPDLAEEWDRIGNKNRLREILIQRKKVVFRKKVQPSLAGCEHVGNIYTGAVFLGLASILEERHFESKPFSGKRVAFLSYGSGSSAVVYSGVIGSEYAYSVGNGILMPALEKRQKITMQQYEALHRGEAKKPVLEKRGQFVLEGIDNNERRAYRFIE